MDNPHEQTTDVQPHRTQDGPSSGTSTSELAETAETAEAQDRVADSGASELAETRNLLQGNEGAVLYAKKIEVCVSNVELGSQYVCDLVQTEFPSIKIRRWGCLGYCHLCVRNPGVLIDDTEYVEAPTGEELWQKVKVYIQSGKLLSDNHE